eukprot:6198646-Pleurochrysis_carterae.AAC.1
MDFKSLTVAAEYPARFASFEGAVVFELVGEDALGFADDRVLWTLDQVKVLFAALPLNSSMQAARHSSLSGWPRISL